MSNSESWTAVLSPITLAAVQAEATGVHAKHGEHSMLGAAVTESDRLAILTEEVGEVARELNEDRLGNLDGDWKIRRVKELIQVAAMALTWVEHLEGNLLLHLVLTGVGSFAAGLLLGIAVVRIVRRRG